MTNPTDIDTPISTRKCVFCGEAETTTIPITIWHFSMPDGHFHILACPRCAADKIGNWLREPAIGRNAYDRWLRELELFIYKYAVRVTLEQ